MDLLDFLEKNNDARRIFGKRELVIVRKQALGVRLTQSERNRLSRDIRPKLAFIKEAARFADEFNLKRRMRTKRVVNEAVEMIREDPIAPRIKRIVLFGSILTREMTMSSDIDIAIDVPGIGVKEATFVRKRLLGKVSGTVDIQVYNILGPALRKAIDSGKTVFSR